MDFINKNRNAIIGLCVIAIGLWAYLTYFAPQGGTLTASSPSDTIGSDLLVTLGSLHTIRLDESIFSNPSFQSLSDFGVTIPPQDSGRRNPFAPVGQ